MIRKPAPRPLQLRELVLAVEEHLLAIALPGLAVSYLPTGIRLAVSPFDHSSLAPFEDELREQVRAVQARLAAQPAMRALGPPLAVELVEDATLQAGAPPRILSSFPAGNTVATWRASEPVDSRSAAAPAPENGTLLELLLTVTGGSGTARQIALRVGLGPLLPVSEVGSAATAEGRWLEESDSGLRCLPDGEPWNGQAPDPLGPLAEISPPELPTSIPASALSTRAWRWVLTGRGNLLWAPAGALLIGRRPESAHLVPPGSPANLSARHLALVRTASGEIAAIDFASTNGTFLEGARLLPFRVSTLSLPATLEFGSEGSLRIEVSEARPR